MAADAGQVSAPLRDQPVRQSAVGRDQLGVGTDTLAFAFSGEQRVQLRVHSFALLLLAGYDANIARAARCVIVTAEEVADPSDFAARASDVLLYAHEVDAVVSLPGGASPCGVGGHSPTDTEAVKKYLAHAKVDAAGAVSELFA